LNPQALGIEIGRTYFSHPVVIADDKEAAHKMIHRSGQMGVPVIFVDDQMMLGFNQSKLDEMLAK